MKQHFLIILLTMVIFSGCEMSGDKEIDEDFKIVNDGEVVLALSDIDYYDFSTHIVYLTENNRLNGDYDKLQGARILVDEIKIRKLNGKIFYLVNKKQWQFLPFTPFLDQQETSELPWPKT